MSEKTSEEWVTTLNDFVEYLTYSLLKSDQFGLPGEIVYYLQRTARIIPDRFSQCRRCNKFYDSDAGGCRVDAENYEIVPDQNDYDADLPHCGHKPPDEMIYNYYCNGCMDDLHIRCKPLDEQE